MVIKIALRTGTAFDFEEKIYRNVAQHNYSAYVAGFFANKGAYQAGAMYQLKGGREILLHTFGANHYLAQ